MSTGTTMHEDLNYASDHRVAARDRANAEYPKVDERRMTLTYLVATDDSDEEVTLPACFVVCATCDGKGRHVNPSIDANGIGAEDLRDDPDFAADYRAGVYDVNCYGCGGRRVVPQVDDSKLDDQQKRLFEAVCEQEREEASYRAAERRALAMGY